MRFASYFMTLHKKSSPKGEEVENQIIGVSSKKKHGEVHRKESSENQRLFKVTTGGRYAAIVPRKVNVSTIHS